MDIEDHLPYIPVLHNPYYLSVLEDYILEEMALHNSLPWE
jgi:hypothetical protein